MQARRATSDPQGTQDAGAGRSGGGLQNTRELGRRLALRDRIQFLEGVRQAPLFNLALERFEIALDSVHADGKRILDREILGMLRENRRELLVEREILADWRVASPFCSP
jgi:hypothetical protein